MYIFSVFLILLVRLVSPNISHYDGFKVYSADFSTKEQFLKLKRHSEDIDFWTAPRINVSSSVKMMVKPSVQHLVTKLFKKENIGYRVVIPNVAQFLHEEKLKRHYEEKRIKREIKKMGKLSIDMDRYLRHSEANEYLRSLEQKYPKFVSVISVGYSYEGRELLAIKISKDNKDDKPIIFIDAGVHAREWLAPATALYIIKQLVENPKNAYLYNNIDWYILPHLNPDGYEYTHTTDRLWRKTRSKGNKCKGVDGNRNFSFLWGKAGTSSRECSEIYKGPFPFSEVELQAFRNLTVALRSRIKLYLTLHSFGSLLLYPFGHDSIRPDNLHELETVANIFTSSLYKHSGEKWTSGNSADIMYPATGASEDWMMGENGVQLSYTVELQEYKGHEFTYPPSKLSHVMPNTFVGIKALHSYIQKKYGS